MPYEPGPSQYATIVTLWGRPVLTIFFGVALLWIGRWLLASLPLLLGALETLLLVVPLVHLAGSLGNAEWLVLLFGAPGSGTGLAEDAVWVLLGVVIFRSGQRLERTKLEERRQEVAEENRRKTRRLYEEAFGVGDLSVVDELVAEDFFDRRHDRHGREEFRRTIAGLRRTFPDLGVSVEEQTSGDDAVETRCVFSGTDRGGVLWYPPTNRRAVFTGTYVDRFFDGMLMVEHGGETDMGRLMEQLGLPPVGGE